MKILENQNEVTKSHGLCLSVMEFYRFLFNELCWAYAFLTNLWHRKSTFSQEQSREGRIHKHVCTLGLHNGHTFLSNIYHDVVNKS